MRTYPQCEFVIFDARVYYNNTPQQSGSKNQYVRNVPPGWISLYEYNIDRQYILDTDNPIQAGLTNSVGDPVVIDNTGRIYPWTTKGSEYYNLKTVSTDDYEGDDWGDVIQGTYPLSASITRELMGIVGTGASGSAGSIRAGSSASTEYDAIPKDASFPDFAGANATTTRTPLYRHYYALKNTLNYYATRSPHYAVSSSTWDKDHQIINMISIPQIFYGTRIKPGSVSLKWYFTGSLSGELRDTRQNGELRQVISSSEHGADYDDECAGVVLYEQGFILLTGSWALCDRTSHSSPFYPSGSSTADPAWIYFGLGAYDAPLSQLSPTAGGSNSRTGHAATRENFDQASFNLSFQGETETQVVTMFSRAGRGEANYSNNATYLNYGQSLLESTSSQFYEENPNRTIYNSVSSSYLDYESPFKRQVYISRVAIYDDKKNLIGVATLGSPVLKKEDQDLTFKLRLDL